MNTCTARVSGSGTKRWYNKKNQLHRENGPAAEYYDGSKAWYYNGKLHRLDGPAVEFSDGDKFWWIRGVKYTEEQFHAKIAEMN